MYMYYSTIVTAPELFIRDSISTMVGNANPIQAGLQQSFFEILLIMMAVAHIWVGIYCHIKWKRFDCQRSSKNIFSLDFILRGGVILRVYFRTLFLDHKYSNNKNISTLDNAGDDLDVRLITWLGIILVPMGIIFCVLFVIIQPDKSNGFCAVIITSFVILVANGSMGSYPVYLIKQISHTFTRHRGELGL